MEKIIPDMDFDIMWEDEKIGHIKIKDEEIVDYSQVEYPNQPWKRFIPMCGLSIPLLAELFEMRCWDRDREDINKLLNKLGIVNYNPFLIVQKTKGVTYDDPLWFRFKGDTVSWKDLNPRKREVI